MSESNPAVPMDGQSLLIGVIGIDTKWYHFDDNVKGRDAALKWLTEGSNPKRLFRVYLSDPAEMTVCPPVPARLIEKPTPLNTIPTPKA